MAGHTVPCFQGLRAGPAGPPCPLHFSLPRRPHVFRRARPAVRAALVAEPATLPVRSFQGDVLDPEKLSLKVADMTTATGLVHRYITLIRQNARRGTASTKTRAEVRGGGKKPYGQKGTGNARQRSKRSPLKRGGGVIFGPKPCDWTISMNKKERRLALGTALQNAAEAITVVDDIRAGITEFKTKAVVEALGRWGVPADEQTLLIVEELTDALFRSTRNLPRLTVNTIGALNAYDVLHAENVVVERAALRFIQEFYGPGRWDALEAAAAETALAPAAEAAEATPAAEAAEAAAAEAAPVVEADPAAEAETAAEPGGEEA